MEHILLIEPNAPQAILWSRVADRSWSHANLVGVDAVIDISALEMSLKLDELYTGLIFRPAPKLVDQCG